MGRTGRPGGLSGSALSRKQISRSVLNGQLVTFTSVNGDPVTGYVFGMDDFHWSVVTEDGDVHLIHKAGAWDTRIHTEHSYDGLPPALREELDTYVQPFRHWVEREMFHQTPSPSARTA